MDPTLAGLLAAIDMGDADAIGMLADWLEERGDSRSIPVRQTTLPDPIAITRTLLELRHAEALIAEGYHSSEIPEVFNLPPEQGVNDGLVKHLWEWCYAEVEQALATRKLTNELAQAIRLTRRAKIDQLLKQFKELAAGT